MLYVILSAMPPNTHTHLTYSKRAPPRGQSLIEFALLLPVILILILLIVRIMLILNLWYTLTATADIAVRAAALTGSAAAARDIVYANMSGAGPANLSISFEPDQALFYAVPTATIPASPLPPRKGTPTAKASATARVTPTLTPTPDALSLINTELIPEHAIKITIVYEEQVVGALLPAWTIRLSANATARLEARLQPLPTLEFF